MEVTAAVSRDPAPVENSTFPVPEATSQVAVGDWRGWDALSVLGFALSNLVMLLTVSDYGFTYDEPPHIRYGERILNFYTSGFQARGSLQTSYVGGFDLVAALLRRVSPFDAFATNHVLCIFVAQCGLLGTWKLGRLLGGRLGGFCAWLFLILTPVYYSHQFNNPKDVPFAAGYIWGLYFVAQIVVAHERSPLECLRLLTSTKFCVQLGLVLGLGMSVRVGGALLVGYLVLALGVVALDRRRVGLRWLPGPLVPLALKVGLALLVAWAILLVCWPKALLAPVQGPAAAVESVTHYKSFDSPTLLRGKLISSHHLPWDYLPTYFAVQLPEVTLLTFLGAVAACAREWWHARFSKAGLPLSQTLVVVAVLLPPAYAIARGSVLYDGLRHFLFIIPPIAVLCGAALSALTNYLTQTRPLWFWATCAVFVLFTLDQLYALVATHPYQHVHFNRVSGGTKPAIARFETEYYGALYQELGDAVAQALWRHDRDTYMSRSYGVAACGSNLFVSHNFPSNFQYYAMSKANRADLFATYPRDRCLRKMTEHPAILEIRRAGATLGVARDLEGVYERRDER